MIPQEITRDHLLRALQEIDEQGVPEGREPTKWYLTHEGKTYPPKYVICIAGKYAQGHEHDHELFSGGPEANGFLESRGFSIVHKRSVTQGAESYWAFLANPTKYRIDDAIKELPEDYWTVGNSSVRKGDKCVIWKSKDYSGNRGVIAVVDVLTDPVEMDENPLSLPYWIGDFRPAIKKRVKVKYYTNDNLPIWLNSDNTGILSSLSVSRGQGSIFKITPEQWSKLSKIIYSNDQFTDITNKVLLKTVGKSQHQDGVRINKEFHEIFNPPSNPHYVAKGQSRPVTVNFNKKIFKAKYVYEGTKADRVLQRIQFSKELIDEFKAVFPSASGFFRIKLENNINNFTFLYDTTDAYELSNKLEDDVKKSRADNREERLSRLSRSQPKPDTVQVTSVAYIRNPDVIVEVLDRSNGICEKCSCNAPFLRRRDSTPYLEVHHKIPLSEGGYDTVDNAIAVCPNCHRKLHYG